MKVPLPPWPSGLLPGTAVPTAIPARLGAAPGACGSGLPLSGQGSWSEHVTRSPAGTLDAALAAVAQPAGLFLPRAYSPQCSSAHFNTGMGTSDSCRPHLPQGGLPAGAALGTAPKVPLSVNAGGFRFDLLNRLVGGNAQACPDVGEQLRLLVATLRKAQEELGHLEQSCYERVRHLDALVPAAQMPPAGPATTQGTLAVPGPRRRVFHDAGLAECPAIPAWHAKF